MARCAIAGASAGPSPRASRRNTFLSRSSASVATASGKVAVVISDWRSAGSRTSTRSISWAKPRSSRRSASSSTSTSTSASDSALCESRSSSRPGVATSRWVPPRSSIICGLMETPPTTTSVRNAGASAWATSPICRASSRVGASTSARRRRGRSASASGVPSSRCSTGSRNAPVLPEPVCASASTSRPCRMGPMAAACTAVGAIQPAAAAVFTSSAPRPSSANVGVGVVSEESDTGSRRMRRAGNGTGRWVDCRAIALRSQPGTAAPVGAGRARQESCATASIVTPSGVPAQRTHGRAHEQRSHPRPLHSRTAV